jgi:hypothetical protein
MEITNILDIKKYLTQKASEKALALSDKDTQDLAELIKKANELNASAPQSKAAISADLLAEIKWRTLFQPESQNVKYI